MISHTLFHITEKIKTDLNGNLPLEKKNEYVGCCNSHNNNINNNNNNNALHNVYTMQN